MPREHNEIFSKMGWNSERSTNDGKRGCSGAHVHKKQEDEVTVLVEIDLADDIWEWVQRTISLFKVV